MHGRSVMCAYHVYIEICRGRGYMGVYLMSAITIAVEKLWATSMGRKAITVIKKNKEIFHACFVGHDFLMRCSLCCDGLVSAVCACIVFLFWFIPFGVDIGKCVFILRFFLSTFLAIPSVNVNVADGQLDMHTSYRCLLLSFRLTFI